MRRYEDVGDAPRLQLIKGRRGRLLTAKIQIVENRIGLASELILRVHCCPGLVGVLIFIVRVRVDLRPPSNTVAEQER